MHCSYASQKFPENTDFFIVEINPLYTYEWSPVNETTHVNQSDMDKYYVESHLLLKQPEL